MTTPYKIGEMVQVSMLSNLAGYEWAQGAVGVIHSATHTKDFSIIDTGRLARPPIREGMWNVSVDDPRAKGGYAFAVLPEELLSPHACTSRCPKHPCLLG